MQSAMSRGATGANGNSNTGQNSWMPSTPFPFPNPTAAAFGSFAGGFHPSAWNPLVPPPPPPSMATGANEAAYNQTSYNYQPQAAWNKGYGGGRGNGAANWNKGQQKPQQFQPFSLNRKNNHGAFPHISTTFVPQGGGPQPLMGVGRGRGNVGAQGMQPPTQNAPPPSAQRYMERAFEAANSAEDRQKTQEYLKKRLFPMLNAGNAHMVNWDIEPLPHEKNYEFMGWTPAKNLPHLANGFYKKKSSPPRRRSDEQISSNDRLTKRARRESDGDASSDSDDQIEILHFATNQKKTKAQKKAEKAARKAQKKQNQKQQVQANRNTWKIEGLDTEARREDRARRFAESLSNVSKPTVSVPQHFFRRGQVIRGTCQNIEKSFFRLTAAPDPSAVRPLEILRLSLDNVRNKYRQRKEYSYLMSQLRSIRQDLTVQRIRNEFTVEVYEINARISLEHADREEFNKCQSQLKLLYSEVEGCKNCAEFVSYRLLYYIAMDNQIDINSLLQELTPELKEDECVSFALKVRKAVAMSNYAQFFKLFNNAPRMCPFIMDLFADRERKKAVGIIQKAFRPTMSYKLMAEFLSMEEEKLVEWLVEELIWDDARVGDSFDCKIARNCA
uniref:SAC3/GANP/THP3 conserved domain-containing protein n=1 Tax=Caenorhabditis japonica TaxID=281687 RepID=A0A8R1HKJ8_CAEJA